MRYGALFSKLFAVSCCGVCFSGCVSAAEPGAVPERASVPEKYRWDLEVIYPTVQDWEASFAELSPRVDALSAWSGRLRDAVSLLTFLGEREAVEYELGRLVVFAHMKEHEDMRETRFRALRERVDGLSVRFGAACSFFVPEVLALDERELRRWLAEDAALKGYAFYLERLLRGRPHVLSSAEEELLARSGEMASTPANAFSLLTNADMKFPTVSGDDGADVELTEERYYRLSRSRNREVRKAAFEGIHDTYGRFRNSIGALYAGSVKGARFYARARRYENSLQAALFGDDVPASVYDHVIGTARRHSPLMKRYERLRRSVLGLDALHAWDLNVPLTDEPVSDIPYEDACRMVLEALAPLGEEYVGALKKGLFEERWVDVYENQGKRKGAYSWGSYGTRPYVLLNYNGTLRDVFTLAHEMGHALHSWYSRRAQPQVYAGYPILLAEVASTTNEMLLLEHLLRKSTSPEEKKWLLTYFYDMMRTTFFRQALFAEFERTVHAHAEEGGALTPDYFSRLWGELNEAYYGPEMVVDEALKVEWARVPHFYRAFYVYQYVTGLTAACALSEAILAEGEAARGRYLTFLKSGASEWPLETLRKAGVDLTDTAPFERTMALFERRLDEGEALWK